MAKMGSFFPVILLLIVIGFFQSTEQNEKGFLCFPEASSLTKASVTFRCDELMKENVCEATIAQLCNGRQSENDMQFCKLPQKQNF
uniref:Chitin-binding type-2 domain-containing protein n=1 Tax=Globodera pallida TaxID=36090 RepID=A0A183BSA2_GLOPA